MDIYIHTGYLAIFALAATECSLKIVIFLNSASSAAALVFYLPLCTLTEADGKPREARVRNIF